VSWNKLPALWTLNCRLRRQPARIFDLAGCEWYIQRIDFPAQMMRTTMGDCYADL
jgi:hypothetical protein